MKSLKILIVALSIMLGSAAEARCVKATLIGALVGTGVGAIKSKDSLFAGAVLGGFAGVMHCTIREIFPSSPPPVGVDIERAVQSKASIHREQIINIVREIPDDELETIMKASDRTDRLVARIVADYNASLSRTNAGVTIGSDGIFSNSNLKKAVEAHASGASGTN